MEAKRFFAPSMKQAIDLIRQELGPNAMILSNRQVSGGFQIEAVSHQAPTEGPGRLDRLEKELETMRALLDEKLKQTPTPTNPDVTTIEDLMSQQLQRLGLQTDVAAFLLSELNLNHNPDIAWQQCLKQLSATLTTSGDEVDQQGGIIALIGQAGVGKTTCLAKLAARYVLQHGPDQIGLVSTDYQRVAGREQLRTYGKILGVNLHAVNNAEQLNYALLNLRDKKLVLIDTMGISLRDPQLTDKLAILSAHPQIKSYLVLSSTNQSNIIDEAIQAFGSIKLHGSIITKVDETCSLGETLNACIRHKLPIAYVSNGQQMPDDIQVAEVSWLIDKTLEPGLNPRPHHIYNHHTELRPEVIS